MPISEPSTRRLLSMYIENMPKNDIAVRAGNKQETQIMQLIKCLKLDYNISMTTPGKEINAMLDDEKISYHVVPKKALQ